MAHGMSGTKMKSVKKKYKSYKYLYDWHEWFAWHPVRCPVNGTDEYRWVWLEPVKRKLTHRFDHTNIEYMIDE